MGIEPTSEAWEASILPLYDARSVADCNRGGFSRTALLRRTIVADRRLPFEPPTSASPCQPSSSEGASWPPRRLEGIVGRRPGRDRHCRLHSTSRILC